MCLNGPSGRMFVTDIKSFSVFCIYLFCLKCIPCILSRTSVNFLVTAHFGTFWYLKSCKGMVTFAETEAIRSCTSLGRRTGKSEGSRYDLCLWFIDLFKSMLKSWSWDYWENFTIDRHVVWLLGLLRGGCKTANRKWHNDVANIYWRGCKKIKDAWMRRWRTSEHSTFTCKHRSLPSGDWKGTERRWEPML